MEKLKEKFFVKVKELKDQYDFSNFGETPIVDFGYKVKTASGVIYSVVDWGHVFNWIVNNCEPKHIVTAGNCAECEYEKWTNDSDGSMCKYHKHLLRDMFNKDLPLDKIGCKQFKQK